MSAQARAQQALDRIVGVPWREKPFDVDGYSDDDIDFIRSAPMLIQDLLRVIANVRMVADVIEQTAAESDLPECYLTADQAAGLIRQSLIEES